MPVSRHHPDTVTKHISWHHPDTVTKHIFWHLPDTVTKQRSSDHLHVLCHLVCFVCYVKDRFLTSSILRSLEISMEGERLIYICACELCFLFWWHSLFPQRSDLVQKQLVFQVQLLSWLFSTLDTEKEPRDDPSEPAQPPVPKSPKPVSGFDSFLRNSVFLWVWVVIAELCAFSCVLEGVRSSKQEDVIITARGLF